MIDILHIAKLANLLLKKDEVKKYEEQLSSILSYIDKLQILDTTSTEETSQTTGLENVTGEDIASPSLSQEEALSNTTEKHNGFFKVKAILNDGK